MSTQEVPFHLFLIVISTQDVPFHRFAVPRVAQLVPFQRLPPPTMVTVKLLVTDVGDALGLVAVTENVTVPGVVGVPDNVADVVVVDAVSPSPANPVDPPPVPLVNDIVTDVEFVALTVPVKAVATFPDVGENDPKLSVNALIVIENAVAADVPYAFVPVMEKLKVPATEGVPEIIPVLELRESPVGKLPVDTAYETAFVEVMFVLYADPIVPAGGLPVGVPGAGTVVILNTGVAY